MDTSVILHEKQEQGSMLCAQHALNNLLQTNLFSASELSNIGRELDQLENDALNDDEALNDRMGNVDDSGFFSVAVIEEALRVVNLRLVRWEHPDMQPFLDGPEHQSAFIFNLQQHWFAMRKFGDSPEFWFNLNSFLPKPERVSQLYLGLQIHQAQREGYSVFAVLPGEGHSTSTATGSFLPPSPADEYFMSNPHLAFTSFGGGANGSNPSAAASSSSSSRPRAPRPRSDSLDSDGGNERQAQRRRITPAGSDEEEEMVRRAIEASMAEAQPSQPPQQRKVHDLTRDSSSGSDEELSTALRASHVQEQQSLSQPQHDKDAPPTTTTTTTKGDKPEDEDGNETIEEEDDDDADANPDDAPTLDELRLKRLARFQ